MPYLTPETLPEGRFCRLLSAPNDPHWIGIVSGALLELTYAYNWEQSSPTALTPQQCADAMYAMLQDYWANSGCPTVPAPYWDEASTDDDEAPADNQSWYGIITNFLAPIEELNFEQNAAVWVITGFVAASVGLGAAIFFRTVARRFVVAVQRKDVGEIIRVIVDSAEYDVDTSAYAVGEIIDIAIDAGEGATHDIYVIGTGEGATTQIVRKRLYEDEAMAIIDIQQIAGQLQMKRALADVWENVPNADNVRRDGSTMTGDLNIQKSLARLTLTTPDASNPTLSFRTLNGTPNAADISLIEENAQDTMVFSSPGGNLLINQKVNANLAAIWALYSGTNTGEIRYQGAAMSLKNLASGNVGVLGSTGKGMDIDASGRASFMSYGNQRAAVSIYPTPNQPNLALCLGAGQTASALEVYDSALKSLALLDKDGKAKFNSRLTLQSMTDLQYRDAAILESVWSQNTDATRLGKVTLSVLDWTGARVVMNGSTDGTQATLGFYGSTPTAKPTVTGERAQNAALTSLLEALDNLGLITDDSTPGNAPYVPAAYAITGSRFGVPALASVIEALSYQGIVWDQTTEGSLPSTGGNLCSTAMGVADGWRAWMQGMLVELRSYVVQNPLAPVAYFVVGAAWWVVGYAEANSDWMTAVMAGNLESGGGLVDWLDTHVDGADETERLAQIDAILDGLLDVDVETELRRLAYCNIALICPDVVDIGNYVGAIVDYHSGDAVYDAFADAWSLGVLNLDRVQWWALLSNTCNPDADCSAFECEGNTGFFAFPPINGQTQWVSSFNTVSGAIYKVSCQGTSTGNNGGGDYNFDACYVQEPGTTWEDGTAEYGGTFSAGTTLPLARFHTLPYNADHKYEFFITGDGTPLILQWDTALTNITFSDFMVDISGYGA